MMTDDERKTLFRTEAKVNQVLKNLKNLNSLHDEVTRNTERINIQRWLSGGIILGCIATWANNIFGS